jgi:hypothetical protein
MNYTHKVIGSTLLVGLCLASTALAQDRDHDRDDHEHIARIDPGTSIPVRTNQFIDSDRRDNRVYYGTIDQDVRSEHGRLAIPRGSQVELIVRTARDNDLVLDLESVTINGQRYAIQTDPNHVEAHRDNNDTVVGSIVGALTGDQAYGRRVKIRQGTVLTFRLEKPLIVGVPDRGETRSGEHYHNYYDHH